MICIGAVGTDEVLALAEDAQQAGAAALLLPPLGYQALNEDEVFTLFETVTQHASVPVCIYDNPGTTHFTFSDALLSRIATLSGVGSVKIPGYRQINLRLTIASLSCAARCQMPCRLASVAMPQPPTG